MNLGPAGVPEIAWSLAALAGIVAMLLEIDDARGDLLIMYSLKLNGLRELTAKRAIRRSVIKFGVFLLFLAIGIAAMATPSPEASGSPSPLSWIVAGGLIGACILLVLNAWLDRIDRKRIIAAGSDGQGQDSPPGDT